MAKIFKNPASYLKNVPQLLPSIAQVPTAIPIIIGYTTKAVDANNNNLVTQVINGLNIAPAQRITSLNQFKQQFGQNFSAPLTVNVIENDPVTGAKLAQPAITFVTLLITSLFYHLQLYFANGGGPCYIVSVGNESGAVTAVNLLAGLQMAALYDEPSLIILPQLNLLPTAADAASVYVAALQQAADLKDRFVVLDCYGDSPGNLRANTGILNLSYGAAYHPFLEVPYNSIAGVKDVLVKVNGTVTDFGVLSVEIQAAVTSALLQQNLIVPPSSAIAGIFAQNDQTRGVWKSPAGVSLKMVSALTQQINDITQAALNLDPQTGKSISVIRNFTGKGILVWGARTLAGNDNQWRYIAVRRFFIMVEESVRKALQQFVIKPNNATTWLQIQTMVNNFLTLLWKEGALQGNKPDNAFYVAVGLNKTMTTLDITQGRLIVDIGMAPLLPAEFIIIRITNQMSQS